MMGLPGRERSLTIYLSVWTQCTNVTDGQTDTDRQIVPRLRIASRDKIQIDVKNRDFEPMRDTTQHLQ